MRWTELAPKPFVALIAGIEDEEVHIVARCG
jgi:hypothetical protein